MRDDDPVGGAPHLEGVVADRQVRELLGGDVHHALDELVRADLAGLAGHAPQVDGDDDVALAALAHHPHLDDPDRTVGREPDRERQRAALVHDHHRFDDLGGDAAVVVGSQPVDVGQVRGRQPHRPQRPEQRFGAGVVERPLDVPVLELDAELSGERSQRALPGGIGAGAHRSRSRSWTMPRSGIDAHAGRWPRS